MRALIIVAHGSRKKASSSEVAALVKKVEEKSHGFGWIAHAFLQFSEPFLPRAIEAAVAQGADQVTLFPLFIATGSHVLTDIPETVARAAEKHPEVSFTITRHLGVIDTLEDLILDEVAARTATNPVSKSEE